MSKIPILPLNVNDLLSDTDHLSNEEFGAYCRFLFGSWQRGGKVAADEAAIRRLIHADRRWGHLKKMLLQFVIWGTDFVHQKRLLATHISVSKKIQTKVGAADSRWGKKRSKNKVTTSTDASANASAPASANADAQEPVSHMQSRARVSEPDTDPSPKGDGSGSPLPPQEEAASPRAEIGYVAPRPAARSPAVNGRSLATPAGPARVQGTRLVNDWDLAPTPGPKGETAFLKRFAAFQAGDHSALDPLPSIPNAGANANPALTAKIRSQLNLPPMENARHEDVPQADQDDLGFAQRPQRTQDQSGPQANQAGPRDSEAGTPPGNGAARNPDPGGPGQERQTPPLKDDDPDDDPENIIRF